LVYYKTFCVIPRGVDRSLPFTHLSGKYFLKKSDEIANENTSMWYSNGWEGEAGRSRPLNVQSTMFCNSSYALIEVLVFEKENIIRHGEKWKIQEKRHFYVPITPKQNFSPETKKKDIDAWWKFIHD